MFGSLALGLDAEGKPGDLAASGQDDTKATISFMISLSCFGLSIAKTVSFFFFFFPSFGQTQLEARDRGGWVTLPYRSTSRGPEMVRGRAGWGTDLMAERIAGIPRPD